MQPEYALRFVSVIGHPLLIIWEYDDWFLGKRGKKGEGGKRITFSFSWPYHSKGKGLAGMEIWHVRVDPFLFSCPRAFGLKKETDPGQLAHRPIIGPVMYLICEIWIKSARDVLKWKCKHLLFCPCVWFFSVWIFQKNHHTTITPETLNNENGKITIL